MPIRGRRRPIAAVCLLLASVTRAAGADFGGHWHLASSIYPPFGDTRLDIEQQGEDVTVSYRGSAPVDATVTGNTLTVVAPQWPGYFYASITLELIGDSLEGAVTTPSPYVPGSISTPISLVRCECFDGNSIDGDGCSAQCTVEPCYSCDGDPSVCTPVADGSDCETLDDCTTGGTCTGGVCGDSTRLEPCVDLTGRWLRYSDTRSRDFQFFVPGPTATISNISQRYGRIYIPERGSGLIDLASGEFRLETPGPSYCESENIYDASAKSDGQAYDGWGNWGVSLGGFRCYGYAELNERGFRCGGGVVDPGPDCLVDSCVQCSGDPPVCDALPDLTPCRHDNPCTEVATCHEGRCLATVSDTCPVCTVCDGDGGCKAEPRNNCRASGSPESSQLAIANRDGWLRSALSWGWYDGEATSAFDLGRPDVNSDVALCLFDGSNSKAGSLLERKIDPSPWCSYEDSECGINEAWKRRANGGLTYRTSAEMRYYLPIASCALKPGKDGHSQVRIRFRESGILPDETPLPLPLRAQLQIDGGACFETIYEESGVSRNSGGVFRARGSR